MADQWTWSRAVWIEDGKQTEASVPSVWICGDTLHWPSNYYSSLTKKQRPGVEWTKYKVLKIKFTDGKLGKSYFIFSIQIFL